MLLQLNYNLVLSTVHIHLTDYSLLFIKRSEQKQLKAWIKMLGWVKINIFEILKYYAKNIFLLLSQMRIAIWQLFLQFPRHNKGFACTTAADPWLEMVSADTMITHDFLLHFQKQEGEVPVQSFLHILEQMPTLVGLLNMPVCLRRRHGDSAACLWPPLRLLNSSSCQNLR